MSRSRACSFWDYCCFALYIKLKSLVCICVTAREMHQRVTPFRATLRRPLLFAKRLRACSAAHGSADTHVAH